MAGQDKAKTVPALSARRGARRASEDATVGNALRAAYQSTVEEGVPDELLDLLKKLN